MSRVQRSFPAQTVGRFLDAIGTHFAFLESEYGFALESAEEVPFRSLGRRGPRPAAAVRDERLDERTLEVRWLSSAVRVSIFVAPNPNEFDLHLARAFGSGARLPWALALRMAGAPAAEREEQGWRFGNDIAEAVATRAEGLRRRGAPWLRGDADAFEALDAFMRLLSGTPDGEFLGRGHKARLPEPVDEASGGYAVVAELLRRLPGRRDADELCVLRFAERMLAEGLTGGAEREPLPEDAG